MCMYYYVIMLCDNPCTILICFILDFVEILDHHYTIMGSFFLGEITTGEVYSSQIKLI